MKQAIRCSMILLMLLVFSTAKTIGEIGSTDKISVVFYNVENLFDPSDDPNTNDEEFTPTGKNHWTHSRLKNKVMMVYRALISASDGHLPDIIGLVEIENLWVVEYLVKNTPLQNGNYGIIHKESPDPRGIDVALLYRKETVKPIDFDFIPVHGSASSHFISRDILHFKAGIAHDTIHFFVNHWPSRSGGYVETQGKRVVAARILRQYLNILFQHEPKGKLLLMGDFNATPDEKCFTGTLSAGQQPTVSNPTQLINLSQFWTNNKTGTIRTKGHWEIFDQFICSEQLLHGSGLILIPSETIICTASFLLEPDNRYLGQKPFRTYLGPVYQGGVSDHLPISTVIREKVPKVPKMPKVSR